MTLRNARCNDEDNINLIYLSFIHCTNKQMTELNWKLNLTNDNKDDDWSSNQIGKARHVIRTRMLRRAIVFLRVRCSICVRSSILLLLIKTVRCSIPHCIYTHFSQYRDAGREKEMKLGQYCMPRVILDTRTIGASALSYSVDTGIRSLGLKRPVCAASYSKPAS